MKVCGFFEHFIEHPDQYLTEEEYRRVFDRFLPDKQKIDPHKSPLVRFPDDGKG
jgi:hypothetical protein